MRFTKKDRLPDTAAFGRVFSKASRSGDRLFTVLSRQNGLRTARLGLAISKKHCKLAVGRNRIKRMARESFRRHKAELAGIDVIVLNRPATHTAANNKLSDSLEAHWKKTSENVRKDAPPSVTGEQGKNDLRAKKITV